MSGRDEEMRRNPGVKLTYEDFLLFPDDGKRDELSDGEHYVTSSPSRRHQRVLELAVERNDTLTTPLLPHLTLPLQQIFKD